MMSKKRAEAEIDEKEIKAKRVKKEIEDHDDNNKNKDSLISETGNVETKKTKRIKEVKIEAKSSKFHTIKEDPRSRLCPYLDTIKRQMLDFDFEKLCSISLSHLNVYACLVCGKYFQGRGTNTHAHTHSVDEEHHVFLNLETHKFYCLPDNYEIKDSSLEDITYLLNPIFTKNEIRNLDKNARLVRAFDGNTYYPGIVGVNNIKANDYCNVVIQMLSHIPPLRNYFLREENYTNLRRPPGDQMIILVQRFGELIRKLWNRRNFKTHVSPHEFLQAVVLCSHKRFQFTKQGDAVDFVSWLLNTLHTALNGTKKLSSSIINLTFRGKMLVYSRKVIPDDLSHHHRERLAALPEYAETVEETPFLYLACDLPPPPLYPDEMKEQIIPQVPMATLLSKFNGVTEKEYKTHVDSTMKRFQLTHLPPYIMLYMKRFVKNIFTVEKNKTIVNFPIKSIDFGELLPPIHRARHRYTTYDLIANLVHDGPPDAGVGTYRVHIMHRGTGKWFEMQDLHVQEVLPQMIPLSETLVQVWEMNREIENPHYGRPVDPVTGLFTDIPSAHTNMEQDEVSANGTTPKPQSSEAGDTNKK